MENKYSLLYRSLLTNMRFGGTKRTLSAGEKEIELKFFNGRFRFEKGFSTRSSVVCEDTVASNVIFTVIYYVTACSLVNGPKLHGVRHLNIYVKVIRDQIH